MSQQMNVKAYKGTLCLQGQWINTTGEFWLQSNVPEQAVQNRVTRDGGRSFHMTIISPDEVSKQNIELIKLVNCVSDENDTIKCYDIGLAIVEKPSAGTAWYAVVYCDWADRLRASVNLPPKNFFHVTLGFTSCDFHGAPNLVHHIKKWNTYVNLLELTSCLSLKQQNKRVMQSVVSSSSSNNNNNNNNNNSNNSSSRSMVEPPRFSDTTSTSSLAAILRFVCDEVSNNYANERLSGAVAEKLKIIGVWSMEHGIVDLVESLGYFLLQKGYLFAIQLMIFAASATATATVSSSSISTSTSSRVEEPIHDVVKGVGFSHDDIAPFLPVPFHLSDSAESAKESKRLRKINTALNFLSGKRARILSVSKPVVSQLDLFTPPRNFSSIPMEVFRRQEVECTLTAPAPASAPAAGLLDCLLFGSAYPTKANQMAALYGLGIRHVITMHEHPIPQPLSTEAADYYGMQLHFTFLKDRTPPTRSELHSLCEQLHTAFTREEGVLVHCEGGVGRTNTVIAAYLIWRFKLSSADAIAHISAQRKLILDDSQVLALKAFWAFVMSGNAYSDTRDSFGVKASETNSTNIVATNAHEEKTSSTNNINNSNRNNSHSKNNSRVPSPSSSPYAKIAKALKLPPVIMLCGLAASGKSTFSNALVKAHPDYFMRINRDDMRGKGQCDEALAQYLKVQSRCSSGGAGGAGVILLDGCHLTKEKRAEWRQAVHNVDTWCVFFDTPLEQCQSRIRLRQGHPTIPPGEYGITVLKSMAKQLEPPVASSNTSTSNSNNRASGGGSGSGSCGTKGNKGGEGFSRVIVLRSEEEVVALLQSWSIDGLSTISTTAAPAATATAAEKQTREEEAAGADAAATNKKSTRQKSSRGGSISSSDGSSASDDDAGAATATSTETETSTKTSTASSTVMMQNIVKFPRTAHALDLGAATRDDKVLSSTELQAIFGAAGRIGPGATNYRQQQPQQQQCTTRSVVIEEKVDGANFGISLSPEGAVVCQNRSHIVTSSYHAQFAPLDRWIAKHMEELWEILVPGRNILYGEWLYATHSVKYDKLPGWFVAYDLYDRETKTFASRAALAAILDRANASSSCGGIPHVPLVYEGAVTDTAHLNRLMMGKSEYSSTERREGIVIRIIEGEHLVSRAKLVRSDFIAGNERWNRTAKLAVNEVDRSLHGLV